MRILPDTCASISWPLSSSTLNCALGNASMISPSCLIGSCLAISRIYNFFFGYLRNIIKCAENFSLTFSDDHIMLKMSSSAAISSNNCPSIVQGIDPPATCCDHRLDSQRQTCPKSLSPPFSPKVWNGRIFMTMFSQSMADKIPDDTEIFILTVCVDGTGHIANPVTMHCLLNTFIAGHQCHLKKSSGFIIALPHHKGVGVISEIPVLLNTTIDGDDVSLLQCPFRGYAMNYLVIDRDAESGREWIVGRSIPFKGCTRIMTFDKLFCNAVKLQGGYTWLNILGYFGQSSRDQLG